MTAKQYAIIGKAYVKRGADAAGKTADVLLSFPAIPSDFSLMGCYYRQYTETIYEITAKNKRVFLCAMLQRYMPYLFQLPAECTMRVEGGFLKAFCTVTNSNKGNVSVSIRQVIFEYKTYDDFRSKCDDFLNGISKYKIAG
ncbi:MAG TPA: hypothetical protein PL085_11645 [Agriterribacter sp.]|uniref:hypothetical protein n=1 Tax=Agriterribacter sp. TaxID=2821509 RepID=UPI002D0D95DA|nr:hypothetical protein [Agriterribacter sp.]HRQ17722.1 hypothetical protein [Agriterribacter sp.]